MMSDTNLESQWKAQRYTNLCNLDGNQIWIKSGPSMVYFQELSLSTEEVSIFRLIGSTDCLLSLVVRHINSGSKACVFVHKRN